MLTSEPLSLSMAQYNGRIAKYAIYTWILTKYVDVYVVLCLYIAGQPSNRKGLKVRSFLSHYIDFDLS